MHRYKMALFGIFFYCNVFAQTYTQQNLVSSFVSEKAGKIIASWAHPMSAEQSYSITNYGHTYYISINYKYNGNYFTCTHRWEMNSAGTPQQYTVSTCGAPGLWECFEGLDMWKGIASFLTEDEKDKMPRLIGKTLSQFSVIDACYARLYYTWKDGRYYNAY